MGLCASCDVDYPHHNSCHTAQYHNDNYPSNYGYSRREECCDTDSQTKGIYPDYQPYYNVPVSSQPPPHYYTGSPPPYNPNSIDNKDN